MFIFFIKGKGMEEREREGGGVVYRGSLKEDVN